MIAGEREFLKAHGQLEQLVERVRQASEAQVRMDQVERTLFTELLALGATLLKAFVAAAGDGDVGESLELPGQSADAAADELPAETAVRTLRRLPKPHARRYVSIFGELTIGRFVYGTRDGQKIEAVPLDAQLGLPAGEFSYVLEDWQQRLCVQESFLPNAIGVLDIFHVLERLWVAAHVFHAEGSPAAEQFVTERLRMLLEGRVGGVLGGFRQMLAKHRLPGPKRRSLETVIGYFENNRSRMRYDEYLAAGYPIGSGVAEGACRHLVKDRLEQTGMRWTVEGAQALLHLRSLYLNGDWPDFIAHRIQQEQQQLYPDKTLLAP